MIMFNCNLSLFTDQYHPSLILKNAAVSMVITETIRTGMIHEECIKLLLSVMF